MAEASTSVHGAMELGIVRIFRVPQPLLLMYY